MKARENNKDDRKRRGQHKIQAQIWTDTEKTQEWNKKVVAFTTSAAKADAEEHLRKFGVLRP